MLLSKTQDCTEKLYIAPKSAIINKIYWKDKNKIFSVEGEKTINDTK